MELVLSPGRFGDDTAGVPFEKEEIREWSQVDRLTGMLERARVETGRWQTSNQEAAKSYGKVIDSRERNSADGSVVQRARRQVEIFQSQGRGRSVQVVRASHWSSSRVTDTSIANSTTLPVLDKKEEEDEKFVNSSILETKENCLTRQEAISARLSALIGTFGQPVLSSTVPLRRIDSRYSNRGKILNNIKKSNSTENLAIFTRSKNHDFPILDIETMENHENINDSHRDERKNDKISQLSIKSRLNEDKKFLPIFSSIDERDRTKKLAIQLLPSSRANKTVVNIMSDALEKREISSNDEMQTFVTKNDQKNEDSSASMIFGKTQKSPKRVGFSKTEIHFVADSGKVNIVETDEKPPPTNKFRRKKRLNVATLEKNPSSIVDTTTNCHLDILEKMTNDHQRGHKTTVKLGSEISKNNERANEEIEKIETSETSKISSPLTIPTSSSNVVPSSMDYDVVCKDSENNRVVLKVVKTHEPIIARVETDHLLRKIIKKKPTLNEKSTKINEAPIKKNAKIEHTYVNVFRRFNERSPIYENYKISEINDTRKSDKQSIDLMKKKKKKDAKLPLEKILPIESLNVEKIAIDKNKLIKIPESSLINSKIDKKSKIKSNDDKNSVIDEKTSLNLSSSNLTNSPRITSLRTNKILQNPAISQTVGKNSNSILSVDREKLDSTSKQATTRQRQISATRMRKSENPKKPIEVVYQTAVYNMKNEKLSKPSSKGKGKESRGPRYLNELICGAKTKRTSDSKNKSSSTVQHSSSGNKGASQTVRHWK